MALEIGATERIIQEAAGSISDDAKTFFQRIAYSAEKYLPAVMFAYTVF